ncbi:MAG: signal peptidase I [Acidobacteria bacterium]|nr:MAG: signal peptidase I [Acidobacteriota bacterium]
MDGRPEPAVEAAAAGGGERTAGRRGILREYAEALLVAVIFASFARAFLLQAFSVPTPSMEPSLLAGDHILVNKMIYAHQRGGGGTVRLLPMRPVRRSDVVVFRHPFRPRQDFVKRCVAVPGDTVEIVDKVLWLNGRRVDESAYVRHADPQVYASSPFLDERYRHRDNFGPYTVPPAHYFVLGDNRDESNDSRFWGPVPAANVKGRAFLIYWSRMPAASRDKIGWRPSKLASALKGTRWDRCLLLVR